MKRLLFLSTIVVGIQLAPIYNNGSIELKADIIINNSGNSNHFMDIMSYKTGNTFILPESYENEFTYISFTSPNFSTHTLTQKSLQSTNGDRVIHVWPTGASNVLYFDRINN